MTTAPDTERGPLARGQAALAGGAWEEAFEALNSATQVEPANPEAWESLANACMWLQMTDREIEARQFAYSLYREKGDDRSSARLSLDLVWDFLEVRGEIAVGNGWFQRARRLLAGLPNSPEHALLQIWDSYLVQESDPEAAESHAREAVSIADAVGARDIAELARALHGQVLVNLGRVKEGMSLLDEAVAGAIGREISDPQWYYFACCRMIDACDQVRDFRRSIEWCDQLREFAERWRVPAFITSCRIKYTGALLWRGDWQECESQLEQAITELTGKHPAGVSDAVVRLAEVRRRQGRRREAEDLLDRAQAHPMAVFVRAALALDEDDAAVALEFLEVLLRRTPPNSRTERVSILEMKTRAHVALGQLDKAQESVTELREIVEMIGTDALRATLCSASGLAASAASDYEQARRCFEDATYLFEATGSPYEAARVRLHLAQTLDAVGRSPAAAAAASAALATFELLGAAVEARRARVLTSRVRPATDGSGLSTIHGKGAHAILTRRQREILMLVSQGLNDREIADRLFLSEHTVHRHVANILGRLGVSSRSAAVAQAMRSDYL